MTKKVTCPQCFGTKEVFDVVLNRAHRCNLCDNDGLVTKEVHDKFIKQLNENLSVDEEDFY